MVNLVMKCSMFGALLSISLAAPQVVLSESIRTTFEGPSCPNAPISCSVAAAASCCYEAPGGILLQTQFWDYNPGIGPNDTFTLHGLWPDNCDGSYEQFCDSSLNIQVGDIQNIIVNEFGDQELYDNMTTNWKNYNGNDASLWQHEYNKHATCINTMLPTCYGDAYQQNQNVYDFFRITEALYTDLPTFQFLADAGITPDPEATWTYDQISDALSAGFGGNQVYFKCDNHQALQEVWYFHHVVGSVLAQNFVQIPSIQNSNCPSTGIHFFPKQPARAPSDPSQPHIPGSSGYLRLSGNSGCLISNGQHYAYGTCATYRTQPSTFGGYNLKTSKGFCGFDSKGQLACGGYDPAKFQFSVDKNSGQVGYGGKTDWCFNTESSHGHGRFIQTPIVLDDGTCEAPFKLTLK